VRFDVSDEDCVKPDEAIAQLDVLEDHINDTIDDIGLLFAWARKPIDLV
jgi:hypothetical protein